MRQLPPEIRINKKAQFNLKDFLGVDFTTHESEVNFRRSPDTLNMISGYQGSMDKRTGLRRLIEQKTDFSGKIYAIKKVKTYIYVPVTLERREIDVIIVHAGTQLWAYNSYLDAWQQATVWDTSGDLVNGSTVIMQERETKFIEYNNQSYWTLVNNNWLVNRNDLLIMECAGSSLLGEEGTIRFRIYRNDSISMHLYYPTTSIGRSPNGQTSTEYERPNLLCNVRINRFLSNATDKTFVLDYNGNTYSMNSYGGFVSQKLANGTWGTPHDASNNPITWTYDAVTHSVTFSAVPHATYVPGEDNIEIRFYTEYNYKKVTNIMNDYYSFANYGLNGLNDLIFFCNHREIKDRNKEIWVSIEAQNKGESVSRFYLDSSYYSNLGSNRKLGYSKIGENLILHGEREGGSPVAYLKRATLDDAGELIVTNTPTTSQIGTLSPNAFANLRDDPLFLSESGVTAILIDSFTGIQTMQDRGFYINKRLLEEPNVKNAIGVIYDNKYYIFVDDGYKSTNVYIADPRSKYNEKLSYSESFQYDWYFWKLPVKMSCVHSFEDGIYIGVQNNNGTNSRVLVFKKENDSDAFYDEIIWEFDFWTTSGNYKVGDKVYKVGSGGDYYICIKDNSASNVLLTNESYWIKIIVEKDGFGVITNYKVPILAYWTTPIMNMGDMTSLKTLKNLWVRLGKYANMSARIYYSTQGIVSEKYDGIFDFSNIDFSRFTFSTDTDPSVLVTNRQERKFMSIQFKIESRDSNPFSLLEIVGEFILNGKYKG